MVGSEKNGKKMVEEMGTETETALQQMPKPTRTVVEIVEENLDRIKKSCNYQSGNVCPLNSLRARSGRDFCKGEPVGCAVSNASD